jgi:hypothetical protein
VINVYDATGRKVKTYPINQQNGIQKISLDGFNDGMFFCGLEINGGITEIRKIVRIKE